MKTFQHLFEERQHAAGQNNAKMRAGFRGAKTALSA